MTYGPFFSVKDAAARLGVDQSTVYRLCHARRIAHRRIGTGAGRIVFTEADLGAYLASCVVPVGDPEPASPRHQIPMDVLRTRLRPQGEGRRA